MSREKLFYEGNKEVPFEGWYFKHENGSQTICFIPSFHINPRGEKSAMLQVIANDHVWKIHYAPEQFYAAKGRLYCRIGKMSFPENGISIDIRTKKIENEREACLWEILPTVWGYYGSVSLDPIYAVPT